MKGPVLNIVAVVICLFVGGYIGNMLGDVICETYLWCEIYNPRVLPILDCGILFLIFLSIRQLIVIIKIFLNKF
jgi:hypothetical protein